MVLWSWQSHCESSPGSFDECRSAPSNRRPKTKPDDLRCEFACRLLESTLTVAIYYYYSAQKLILIYRPTEDRRLSRPNWLVTSYIPRWFTRPQTVTHHGTNRVWRSATTLIEANALPLSQNNHQPTLRSSVAELDKTPSLTPIYFALSGHEPSSFNCDLKTCCMCKQRYVTLLNVRPFNINRCSTWPTTCVLVRLRAATHALWMIVFMPLYMELFSCIWHQEYDDFTTPCQCVDGPQSVQWCWVKSADIKIQGQDVMVVNEFVYLGSFIHSTTGSTCDIKRRSSIIRAAMQSPENQIWRSRLALPQRSWSCTTRASYQYSSMVRTAGRYLRRTHIRSMHSTSGVCVCSLASNGTNLYGMMMYGG